MMRPRLARPLALIGLLCLALGCEGVGMYRTDDGQALPEPTSSGLVAQQKSPLPDVPMPIGFRIVPSKSSTSVTPTARIVDHLYQGVATIADTVVYYRRVLKENGWQPVDEKQHGASVTMRYTKAREALEIQVARRSSSSRVVNVNIRIRDTATPTLPNKP